MTRPISRPNGDDANATKSLLQETDLVACEMTAPLPDRLGRYVVVEQLGIGGFAKVLLAHDAELNRQVAIKIPRPERFPDAGSLGAFAEEARTAARLRHPGIVTVFDVGNQGDAPFIVLEYIRGRTLSHLLQHERLSWPAAARMLVEIADALGHAHEQGFVHRDIKPQNILLDSDDRPHIADFGLAVRHRDLIQSSDEAAGTTHYMAPEQVRAENHRIDGRTDIWALGVIFYRMLTGRMPFDGGSTKEVHQAILYADPVLPSQLDETVPAELERICLRCLSRQMAERYRTAADLADDLLEWLRFVSGGSSSHGSSRRRTMAIEPPDASVVPRGLRSFEQEDADFFLRLIPGPRDRDGLPVAVRFWKKRIEEREADRTFRVGVLYGPSGCGKSSLVKAGLLPRLGPEVTALYFDATSRETEDRILRALHRRFRQLPADISLVEALQRLREEPALREGRKVLIVIDQFEQWLDAWQSGPNAELVRALRHCDGGQVQCVVMVRDDFWLPVSRFMRLVETPIVEGDNGMLIDSFDLAHARRVLRELGVAYSRLPENAAQQSAEQTAFIERATQELAEGNRLYPVRLAVFVEMVKDRPWTPATLDSLGGAEGVGTAYLESSVGSQAPPTRRRHQRAARNVLAALLPVAGQIKGSVRTRSDLLRAAEYVDRPDDFEELLHLLDVELRLLTPTRPNEEESTRDSDSSQGPQPETVYQLSHDFLVPSIREWLQRQARGTSRGRLQLLLQEQTLLWNSRRSPRFLPSFGEWVGLRMWTSPSAWTEPQRRMMRAADWQIAKRAALAMLVLVMASLLAGGVYQAIEQRRNEGQAHLLLNQLQNVPASDVLNVVDQLEPYRRWANPQLATLVASESASPKRRVRAAVALLPDDDRQADWLLNRLLSEETAADDFWLVRKALEPHAREVRRAAHDVLDDSRQSPARRFRAACALAPFEPQAAQWERIAPEVVQSLLNEPPAYATHWIESLEPVAHHLRGPLLKALDDTESLEQARVGTLAIFLFDQERLDTVVDLLADAEGGRYRALVELLKRNAQDARRRLHEKLSAWAKNAASTDPEEGSRRTANVVLALFELGDLAPLRRHAELQPDPRVRARLVEGMGPECMELTTLQPLLLDEQESPLRNLAMLAAWRHRQELLAAGLRGQMVDQLASVYEHDSSAEAHSAAGLLLAELAPERRGEIDQKLLGQSPAPDRAWFVNRAGQMMVVVSRDTLPVRDAKAREKVARPFAISATEITADQFRRFLSQHKQGDYEETSRGDDPAVGAHLVHLATYCNELSKLDGLPPEEWCYPADLSQNNADPVPGFQEKRGYRLPTVAEWVLACHCGTITSRFTGEDAQLLRPYAWDQAQSGMIPKPVGTRLPNPLGLFDVFGNASEVCIDDRAGGGSGMTYRRCGQSAISRLDSMTVDAGSDYARNTVSSSTGFRVVRSLSPEKTGSN